MVGLKTFWITLSSLLLLSACVPSTKQTSCKSNEAFNSSLRTCVPVVGGEDSFISIDDFVPHFSVTKSKADYSNVDFSITISNPYANSYTVQWERVFNGTPVAISATSTATSVSLMPAYLGQTLGEIGTHLIVAKVLVGSKIVASHSFELKINDLPQPTINNATVLPSSSIYTFTYTPLDGAQDFQFTIKNNADLQATDNWKTTWSVTKNGAAYPALDDVDSFTTFTSTGTNTTALGDTVGTKFNPSSLGVGSYTIRALVSNDNPGEIVDERTWYVTVKYPDVSKVVSRDIYELTGVPSFTTTVNAYNGIAYNSSTSYNFIPSTVTVPAVGAQANFCVAVNNGDGTMIGGSGVRVDYYLDGVTLIYSGVTTSGDPKICLSDTPSPANIILSNPSSTTTTTHTIVARIVDEDSNVEYTTADLNSGLGTYPISWNISVKPVNSAPTVSFTATSNLSGVTCGAASGSAKTCTVSQDSPFVVGVKATDEFYNTSSTNDADQAQIAYSMILYRNGSAISTCSKTLADVADTNTAGSDFVGPDYLCQFTVPSYDANGPVNPSLYSYSVSITVSDGGSPIAGSTPQTSSTYTYNLSPVTEVNTVPVIVPQGTTVSDSFFAAATSPSTVIEPSSNPASFITEGETLNINVLVTDAERDNHQVVASLCTDASCSSSSQIALKNVTKTDNAANTLSTLTYAIPENVVPVNTAIGTNVPVYFKIDVTDSTDTLGTGLSTSAIFDLNIRNKNPNPQFSGTPSPLTTDSLVAMVGYPLTIDPGTVTDASLVSPESSIGYQWYVDATGAGNAFTAINGATSRRLTWTPSNAIASGSTVNLRLCVHDNTTVNPLPTGAAIGTTTKNGSTNGPNCFGNWDVVVRPNANALANVGGDMNPDVAIWQDTTVAGKRLVYTAYSDNTNIYVDKIPFLSNGAVDTTNFTTMQFPALTGGASAAANSVKDLSIVGDSNNLIIAYQAADSSVPSSPQIRIRKLLKSTLSSYGTKTDSSYLDAGRFGYRYTTDLPTTTAGAALTISSVVLAKNPPSRPTDETIFSITFNSMLADGQTITLYAQDGTAFDITAKDAPNASNAQFCTSLTSGCSTAGSALAVANIINASSNRLIQDFTAAASGSTVQIFGATGGQYLDANSRVAGFIPGKLGKLVSDGTYWYLPFIDLSSAGSINQIRLMRGQINDFYDASTTSIDTSIVYSTTGTVSYFENELNNAGNMVITSINTSSIAKLHVYDIAGSILFSKTLFGGSPVDAESVRVSATVPGNSYYYAVAKVLTTLPSTYEWKIGRYDASLTTSVEDKFSTLSYNGSTTTVLTDDDISDITIKSVPATVTSSEARLLVSSTAGGTDVNLYSVRFRSDNKLSCGVCLPLNTGTEVLKAGNRIGATSIDTDMTIGTAGDVANENQKDVFFAIYGVDSNSDNSYEPIMSIINAEVESINSTTTDNTGTLGHRPPFFGAN